MNDNASRNGIYLMILASAIFAAQDGISRHLAGTYNVFMVVMIRYWFFAAFVILIGIRRAGGLRGAAATTQPLLQSFRAVLLVLEIFVMVTAFTVLGLAESHAVFACYPLLVAALSGPMLGEQVGWRRWSAIALGCVGVLIILRPGYEVFSPAVLIPLLSAAMFAFYNIVTRLVAARDSAATSFFWTGTVGALAATLIGIWFWEPMIAPDWGWMAVLCLTSVAGHWTLIKCYELAEASAVQPFAYLQMVFATAIGVSVFAETVELNVVLGSLVVIAAGLFTLWRARKIADAEAEA